jgi:DNA-binding NarL/FixJ family response regulator
MRILIADDHGIVRAGIRLLLERQPGLDVVAEADHDLVGAVRAVGRGEAFLTNAAERSIIRQWMADGAEGPVIPLTPREEEVVKLIAEAHTNAQIAGILHVSEKTVESHRANFLRKLGMRDRVELVRYAIRRGLVEA